MHPGVGQHAPPEELAVDAGEQAADHAGGEVAGDGADGVVDLQLPLYPAEGERELEARDRSHQ